MKKLITIAILTGTISVLAENYNPPPPCDCTGVGIPTPRYPRVPTNTGTSTTKDKPLTTGQFIFYKAQLTWWMYLAEFR